MFRYGKDSNTLLKSKTKNANIPIFPQSVGSSLSSKILFQNNKEKENITFKNTPSNTQSKKKNHTFHTRTESQPKQSEIEKSKKKSKKCNKENIFTSPELSSSGKSLKTVHNNLMAVKYIYKPD